ncbi:MAG: hypothetical protein R3C59_03610 [Planctomycetaceae bacterium]
MRPLIFTMLLIGSNVSANANWCPFCDAPSLTLAEQVDQSGHLLLGKWLGGEKPTNDSSGSSKFEIVAVARSKGDVFKVGQEIELPQYVAGDQKKQYTLMGPDTKLIDWHVPSETSQDAWEYVSGLPMPVTEQSEQIKRLAYFLDYLEHPVLTVSNDAYAEFAAAPYEVITPLSDRMPREKLRQWVTNPETPVTRLGLYGLLLGLCGKDEDAEAMKQKILHPDSDFRLGIEGVMSGYLIISGEAGLKVLEDSKMQATTYVTKDGEEKKLPFSETYAAMQTLRFMWTYEPDRIPKQRLKESMRTLLERPELADLVIADLARWKDWDVQARLMAMYDEEAFDIPSVKRAIVRYFFYCSKDFEEGKEATVPEYAIAAAEHLKTLEDKDPKTVRNAKRFLVR